LKDFVGFVFFVVDLLRSLIAATVGTARSEASLPAAPPVGPRLIQLEPLREKSPFEVRLVPHAFHEIVAVVDRSRTSRPMHEKTHETCILRYAEHADRLLAPREQPGGFVGTRHFRELIHQHADETPVSMLQSLPENPPDLTRVQHRDV
jgi:hypothetical protein